MNNKIIPWEQLLRLAQSFLKEQKIPDTAWTFGGGTALALYFKHRESKDIDIFLHDVQLLTYLTPRLNDFVADKVEGYTEMSNFLKLNIGEQEIDFIVAPFLTKAPFQTVTINNQSIRIETPVEIVVKKIFYRSESFKVRDIIDLAVVFKNNRKQLLENFEVYQHKIEVLQDRINKLKSVYDKEVRALKIINNELPATALGIVEEFLKECQKLSQERGKHKITVTGQTLH